MKSHNAKSDEIIQARDEKPLFLLDRLRAAQRGIPVTAGLVGINIAIFVLMLILGAGLWHTSSEVQLFWGANFGPATKDGQWWRLASAMFLHFGLVHLVMNMLALWDVGRLVERMYGSTRYLALYFLSGLGGNLLSLVVRGEHAVSGGASGAIFGIYGALLVGLWWERRHLQSSEFRWMFWGGSLFCLVMIAIGQLLPMIDNAAHAGGFLSGVMLGLALLRPIYPGAGITLIQRGGVIALLLVATVVLVVNIPVPRYRWSEEVNARREISAYLRDDAAITNTWRSLLSQRGDTGRKSFSQLAGELEANVADPYEDSFEIISQVHVDPAVPSAAALAVVRRYAELRRDSSRTMVEGLRTRDRAKIKDAIDLAEKSRRIIQSGNKNAEPQTVEKPAKVQKNE